MQFKTSKPWIATTGNKQRRSTTLTFFLRRQARVIFTVKQVSPECRPVGHFSVRGHRGLNRVRFTGRVGRKQLSAGTYTITARTRSGRLVDRVVLVVVDRRAPTAAELAALGASNVCPTTRDTAAATGGSAGGISGNSLAASGVGGLAARGSNTHSGAVLGATVEKVARAIRPGLVVLLGAAIVLLGLGSLPRVALAEPRLAEALARHRTSLVTLGAVAFLAVVIAFLLG